jgi:hypothetical protein
MCFSVYNGQWEHPHWPYGASGGVRSGMLSTAVKGMLAEKKISLARTSHEQNGYLFSLSATSYMKHPGLFSRVQTSQITDVLPLTIAYSMHKAFPFIAYKGSRSYDTDD